MSATFKKGDTVFDMSTGEERVVMQVDRHLLHVYGDSEWRHQDGFTPITAPPPPERHAVPAAVVGKEYHRNNARMTVTAVVNGVINYLDTKGSTWSEYDWTNAGWIPVTPPPAPVPPEHGRSAAACKARELWGNNGHARIHNGKCVVGTIGATPAHRAYGIGDTWEAAFADADSHNEVGHEMPSHEPVPPDARVGYSAGQTVWSKTTHRSAVILQAAKENFGPELGTWLVEHAPGGLRDWWFEDGMSPTPPELPKRGPEVASEAKREWQKGDVVTNKERPEWGEAEFVKVYPVKERDECTVRFANGAHAFWFTSNLVLVRPAKRVHIGGVSFEAATTPETATAGEMTAGSFKLMSGVLPGTGEAIARANTAERLVPLAEQEMREGRPCRIVGTKRARSANGSNRA